MAYGNASKKNVPLDALSQEDLNNIADKVSEKIPTEQKQQIQDLNARTEQVEADIELLKQSGGGKSDVFIVQFDSSNRTTNKTYFEALEAIQQNKIVLLYEGTKYLAMFNGIGDPYNSLMFIRHTDSETVAYKWDVDETWDIQENWLATVPFVTQQISATNPEFVSAVQTCFPDADTMSFPLEETVSEVNEE